ncbi:glycosyltransferase [Luteolibacter flavescens]|uniref:Glycosyltransferase n=1 Tax=Luteolibacter flavescens TaxID=1859460 RepID=A0ABT3FUS4_9BACT|nr:glycosyltransferase [Luteolibacter flavescens]MCW1887318.1 glycosyltransferase [Luteolibacter flavescens]
MKILHILATPRAEGTPNLVLDWLGTGLHEQEVFVLHSQPSHLSDRLRDAASWYGETDTFQLGKGKFVAIARRVREVCVARRPQLVICWTTGFSNWVCLGAKSAGNARLLVHCGNPTNRSFKHDWITRYVTWPLSALGAKCICCSDFVRNSYQAVPGVSSALFHTVYNCSRAEQVSRIAAEARRCKTADQAPTAIMVATLERHKDHVSLLQALPAIISSIPDFRLWLAGEGSLREELEILVDQLGMRSCVSFLGMRDDVPSLLGQADMFVFSTTRQEGLGSVLLEALAAGLPIVATDVPACRELLRDGAHGTLVPPADAAALARAIIAVLSGPTCEAALSQDYAQGFTASRMIAGYLEIANPPADDLS